MSPILVPNGVFFWDAGKLNWSNLYVWLVPTMKHREEVRCSVGALMVKVTLIYGVQPAYATHNTEIISHTVCLAESDLLFNGGDLVKVDSGH